MKKASLPSSSSIVWGTPAIQMSLFLLLFGSSFTPTMGFIPSPTSKLRSDMSCSQMTKQKTALLAKDVVKREITSSEELESLWNDEDNEAAVLSASGDTQIIGSPDHPSFVHPVVKVLHDRKRKQGEKTSNNKSEDGQKIALVIEGGGMRGCVTGGMVCAIDYLGLRDCVDVVYGSSAGSIIGAYFNTGQLPWFGPEVYYDQLTTAGKSFIDTSRLLRALGLGLLNPKLLKDVLFRRNSGKPLLDLDFLLRTTMQEQKPLNWETFMERQEHQPLKVVASALKKEDLIVMSYEDKHFESLQELSKCMHGSALLPGIAGPVVNLLVDEDQANNKPKFVLRNNYRKGKKHYEPLADALVYAPIPYEVAMQEGATHMVVLRSKPDGGDVIGKGGSIGEKLVWSRFFLRKNKLPKIYERLTKQLHKKLYAKNVLELNEAAVEPLSSKLPPTLTVAIPGSIEEVPRLEARREAIFESMRDGFARAYDALVEDPSQRGKGYEVAKRYFPDEILDYDPQEMLDLQAKLGQKGKAAFETYLEQSGVWPKAWEGLIEPPLGHSSDRTSLTKKGSSSNMEANSGITQ